MDPHRPAKKTRWWLVLLLVFGGMGLLGVAVIGGAVWWFSANKDRLLAEGKESVAEAEAFATNHDQTACVDEGLRRGGTCDGFVCEVKAKVFTTTCLQRAAPTPGLCTGVPAPTEIIKTASWVIDECQRRGKRSDDQRCQRLVQAVPEACQHPSAAPTTTSTSP